MTLNGGKSARRTSRSKRDRSSAPGWASPNLAVGLRRLRKRQRDLSNRVHSLKHSARSPRAAERHNARLRLRVLQALSKILHKIDLKAELSARECLFLADQMSSCAQSDESIAEFIAEEEALSRRLRSVAKSCRSASSVVGTRFGH